MHSLSPFSLICRNIPPCTMLKMFNYLSNYQLLRKDCVWWSYFFFLYICCSFQNIVKLEGSLSFLSYPYVFMCNFCKVNEGVRQKENSDRLEWLQRCVQCDGLGEELVFNSMTNSLGPRKFLHFGVLRKVHCENLKYIIMLEPDKY